jgi:hypothetical protein
MAKEADVAAAIQQLADSLVAASNGSIDYAVNAKAIALTSSLVTDRLRELLSTGYRLKDITPITGFGSSLRDFRLRFHLETDDIIDVPTADFIVLVELTTKSVKRILDANEAVAPSTVPVPFSLAVPSQARQIQTPVTELTTRFNRAQAFFQRQFLPGTEGQLRLQGYNALFRSGMTVEYSTSMTQEWCQVDTYDENGNTSRDEVPCLAYDATPDVRQDEIWA